jgi:hypothetical protein
MSVPPPTSVTSCTDRGGQAAGQQGAPPGAAAEVRGRDEAAATFAGRARAARSVLVDGVPGAAWVAGGRARIVFRFALDDAGRISTTDLVADAVELRRLSVGS